MYFHVLKMNIGRIKMDLQIFDVIIIMENKNKLLSQIHRFIFMYLS